MKVPAGIEVAPHRKQDVHETSNAWPEAKGLLFQGDQTQVCNPAISDFPYILLVLYWDRPHLDRGREADTVVSKERESQRDGKIQKDKKRESHLNPPSSAQKSPL